MIHYIYKITNVINGKGYIGKHSTNNINDGYFGSGATLKKAISKYGRENFNKVILCFCQSEDELNNMEMREISQHGTYGIGYNLTKGGEGKLGYKPTAESVKQGAKSRREYYRNNPQAGLLLSMLAKERTGSKNSFYGKKLSKSQINKMTIARVKAITGENNPSARAVICVETGVRYSLAKDAAAAVGLKYSTTILKCCKGTRKKAGGYTWIYDKWMDC